MNSSNLFLSVKFSDAIILNHICCSFRIERSNNIFKGIVIKLYIKLYVLVHYKNIYNAGLMTNVQDLHAAMKMIGLNPMEQVWELS